MLSTVFSSGSLAVKACFLVGGPVILEVLDSTDGPAHRNLDEATQIQTIFNDTVLIACSI